MSGSDFQENSISQRQFGTEGKISTLDPQGQVLFPEAMHLLQKDREQGIRDKKTEEEDKREGEGSKEKGAGVFVLEGRKLPLEERRQMWHIGGTRGNPVLG